MASRNETTPRLRALQKPAVEAILNGYSTIIVAGPKTGKTFGYVLPIVNTLARYAEDTENKIPGNGPLAIIMCTTTSACMTIEPMCRAYAKSASIFVNSNAATEKEKHDALTSGCELLISTIHGLEEALASGMTNLNRLEWIVFDQFDQLSLPRFDTPFREIEKRCEIAKMLSPIKFIVVTTELTAKLGNFIDHFVKEYTLVMLLQGKTTVETKLDK